MSAIVGLRDEVWQSLSVDQRVQTLQQLENDLAKQDARIPCEVQLIPNSYFESPNDRPYLRGVHPEDSHDIYINEALVNPNLDYEAVYLDTVGNEIPVDANTPYMAAETLFHEDRHAHQEYVAESRPDLALSPKQLEDFQKNRNEGYLSRQDGFEFYYNQPTETDARATAREEMNSLYIDNSTNPDNYLTHRGYMDDEEAGCINRAVDRLGENYQEVVRQEAFERYDASHTEIQSESNQLAEQPLIDSAVTSELDDGYDYGYGL